jgi:hypothetical protein
MTSDHTSASGGPLECTSSRTSDGVWFFQVFTPSTTRLIALPLQPASDLAAKHYQSKSSYRRHVRASLLSLGLVREERRCKAAAAEIDDSVDVEVDKIMRSILI